ncbi:MAG: cyclic pyranopterin monophosphate synthase MoaC [Halobacteriota archaeon]|nr:cyclic pyranopterin monophosphate synthase MoaC [Halobacteriota archaeon]
MLDVVEKEDVLNKTDATGIIKLHKETIEAINEDRIKKGKVLECARIAAILAIKRTSYILPMSYNVSITGINVDFKIGEDSIDVLVEVRSAEDTVVEMEALCGVSVALLTIWDMVKSVEKDKGRNYPHMVIHGTEMIEEEAEVPGFEEVPAYATEEEIEVEDTIDEIEEVDKECLRELLEIEGLSHLIVEDETSKDIEKLFRDKVEEIAHEIHIKVCELRVSAGEEVNVILIYSTGFLFRLTDEEVNSKIEDILSDKLRKLDMDLPLNVIVKKA